MNSHGVRPNKLWHWFAVAFLVATFLAEPRAFMALTWELFRGAGAIGGELLTGDPEPDVLNLDPEPEAGPDNETNDADDSDRGEGDELNSGPPTSEAGTISLNADHLRSVLDAGTETVLALHDRIEGAQAAGGLTVEIGGGS